MSSFQFVISGVLALSILSGVAATAIVLVVDTKQRPGARVVATKLMEVALLGMSAIAALLVGHV
ncbi:MAG TPA: hypothetical protein VGN97_14780 [Mesorhizobium sp.]|jgi:hypothetical protein|nr:hypothetical protein [Mesorhizobium sp.]